MILIYDLAPIMAIMVNFYKLHNSKLVTSLNYYYTN